MFYEKLKLLRINAGLSQYSLADALSIPQSTIGGWESGKREPKIATVQRLADFFGVSVDYLLGRDSLSINFPPSPSIPGGKWIPVLGTIQAGIPVEAINDILDYEEITPNMSSQGEHFALKIKGQSMEPKMSEGDIVIVRKQSDCDSGDTAVVLVNGNEATIKRIQKTPEGVMLVPNNPVFETLFFSNEKIENLPVIVIGKVVELRAKI